MTAAPPSRRLDERAVVAMRRTLATIRRPLRRSRRALLLSTSQLRQPPPPELAEHLLFARWGVSFR